MSRMWCTECFTEGDTDCCECGARAICAAAPGEQPIVIAHLALLDSTAPPAEILGAVCEGPRRVVGTGPFRISSWRHRRRTVWMWRASCERMPRPGTEEDSSLWRLLASSDAILLDAPQTSALFAAQYARNRNVGAMPSLPELLDRIQVALELCGSRPRVAVLIDPSGAAGKDAMDRLALIASPSIASSCAEAVWNLLSASAQSSLGRRWPAPRLTLQSPQRNHSEEPPSEPPQVRILAADVGGSVASHLMVRLHQRTSVAVRKRGRPGNVLLGGKKFTIKAVPSSEGLQAAESYEFSRRGEPPPGFWQPKWDGLRVTWFRDHPFSVELFDDEGIEKPCAMIVGVGPYRIVGERELCALLDRVWQGQCVPAAVVAHQQCDQRLLRWVSREFPDARLWPDTWEGNLAAIEQALILTGRYRS
jgi:hypothetical protein